MKNYSITKECEDFFKVRVEDEYGFSTTVYEKTRESASKFIMNWWKNSNERKESNDLLNKAISNCIKLDKKAGITSKNYDCLD